MNQRELVNLVFGIILIIGLFIGFTWAIDNVQADDYNNTLYQFDIYVDHHHFTPTPCATFTPGPIPPTDLPPSVTPWPTSMFMPTPTSAATPIPGATSTATPTPTPYPENCPTPTPPPPPPTPLPTATPAPIMSVISPTEGGSLRSNDTDASIYFEFDSGVVETETIVTYFYYHNYFPLKPNNLRTIDRSFSFEASQNGMLVTQFNKSYNITIAYPVDMTVDPEKLNLYRLEGGNWVDTDITIISWVDELVVSTNRLGEFSVMWKDNRVHLPLILK